MQTYKTMEKGTRLLQLQNTMEEIAAINYVKVKNNSRGKKGRRELFY
jgi:hypothetical protein